VTVSLLTTAFGSLCILARFEVTGLRNGIAGSSWRVLAFTDSNTISEFIVDLTEGEGVLFGVSDNILLDNIPWTISPGQYFPDNSSWTIAPKHYPNN